MDILEDLHDTKEYFADPDQGGDAVGVHACVEAMLEIRLLRKAVVKYGDRIRMATIHDMAMQQAVDRAFERTD